MDNKLRLAERNATVTGELVPYWTELARAGMLDEASKALPLDKLNLASLLALVAKALVQIDTKNGENQRRIRAFSRQDIFQSIMPNFSMDLNVGSISTFLVRLAELLEQIGNYVDNNKDLIATLEAASELTDYGGCLNVSAWLTKVKTPEELAKEAADKQTAAIKRKEQDKLNKEQKKFKKQEQERAMYEKLKKKFDK